MVRAVEVQGVVQRNQDMASISQNENEKPFINQQNIAAQEKKNIEVKSKEVTKKDNADNNSKNPDAKEKGNNEYFGDGGRNRKHISNTEGTVTIKGRKSFDAKA